MKIILHGAVVALAVAAATPAEAAVIFTSVTTQVSLLAYASPSNGPPISSVQDQDIGTSPGLTGSMAGAAVTGLGASATSNGSASALIGLPSTGLLQMAFDGAATVIAGGPPNASASYDGSGNIRYDFTLTSDAVLSFSYATSEIITATAFYLYRTGNNAEVLDIKYLPGIGSYSSEVLTAGTYRFDYQASYYGPSQSGPGTSTAAFNTQLNFSINDTRGGGASPAPEPATWAMLVAGFGAVGGALRRRATGRPALAF